MTNIKSQLVSKVYITHLDTPTKMFKSLPFTHRALSHLTFHPHPPSAQVLLLRCVTSCMTCSLVTNTPAQNKHVDEQTSGAHLGIFKRQYLTLDDLFFFYLS